jgi:hypothetical protein
MPCFALALALALPSEGGATMLLLMQPMLQLLLLPLLLPMFAS